MATFIHMLTKSGKQLNVAAYYPVPDHIYDDSSVDPTRIPASDRLTQDEINDVKNGKLFEVLSTQNVGGKNEAQVKDFLEQKYASGENQAMNDYTKMFSGYVGEAWDGTSWS